MKNNLMALAALIVYLWIFVAIILSPFATCIFSETTRIIFYSGAVFGVAIILGTKIEENE